MTAEPYGNFRFLVKSENNKDAGYLVDLLEYKGRGRCDCWSFITTCKPFLDKPDCKIEPHSNKYRCKHLIYILSMIGAQIVHAAYEKNKIQKN